MATENSSRNIGSIDCVVCGETMPVKQNGRDTLNLSCPWCGFSAYAKGGTEAHGIVAGWLRNDAAPVEAVPAIPAAAPVSTPAAPAPASPLATIAKAVKKGFDLESI